MRNTHTMHGRKGELLIIASCPGDNHPGKLHTRFSKYDGKWVAFCPVQYDAWFSVNNKAGWKPWWEKYVSRAVERARTNSSISKAKIVAIKGGGDGCATERKQLKADWGKIKHLEDGFAAYGLLDIILPGMGSLLSKLLSSQTPVTYHEVDADALEKYINRETESL